VSRILYSRAWTTDEDHLVDRQWGMSLRCGFTDNYRAIAMTDQRQVGG
jgi:hypothetical protein